MFENSEFMLRNLTPNHLLALFLCIEIIQILTSNWSFTVLVLSIFKSMEIAIMALPITCFVPREVVRGRWRNRFWGIIVELYL
jgi:hypothetical protein